MSDHSKSLCEIEEANWESLPTEIRTDILLRLPIKTVLTCTSVSKSCYSLIKSPNFISTHLNHNNHNHTHLLLLRKLVKDHERRWLNDPYSLHWDNEAFDEHTRFDFPFHGRRLNGVSKVVGTCNGLVCLADDYNFFVWNPCIRKYVTLPKPDDNVYTSKACYGFGFDSKTNDYKVVRVLPLSNWGEYPPKVDVYSLATMEWKMVTAVPPKCSLREHGTPTFVNGALHWPVFRWFHSFVLAFNLGDEDFREIKLPEDLPVSVSVCGESLALFRGVKRYDLCIDVWVMKEYGVLESWTKVLTVGARGPGVEVPLIFNFQEQAPMKIVGFRKSEVVIEMEEGKLVSIDIESKKVKDVRVPGHAITFVHPYVESLVILDKSEDAVSC